MRSQRISSAVGIPARIGGSPGIRTPTSRIKSPLLCRSMLVIQFAKLFHRGRKLRGFDFPFCRPALGGVANKLQFVGLVDRHGTAPRSHGLKGQRATFLLAVLRLAMAMPGQDLRFVMRAVCSALQSAMLFSIATLSPERRCTPSNSFSIIVISVEVGCPARFRSVFSRLSAACLSH
jgi:hypothetical protein